MTYSFTEQEMQQAYDEWGCNCGPSALALVLQTSLGNVRHAIPGFDDKRYTSPSMMSQALRNFSRKYKSITPADKTSMHQWKPCLVRIQWCGPWTEPGANPKWAYRQTHWIATFMVDRQAAMVFDCNGGIRGFTSWQDEIVPVLTAIYPRSSGEWFPTHIWMIE